jgi:serine/threonine-protein kinase HipA
LVTERKLEGVYQESPYLLREIGHGALGALSFFEPGVKPLPKELHAEQVLRLDSLMAAAERFEAGDRRLDEPMLRLLASGGSPGGARPKALAADGQTQWIAKFPSRQKDEGLDVVGLEGACMALAGEAGLPAAKTEIRAFPSGNVLLVERFDLTPNGGRKHMISLRTLCREMPGAYVLRYKELMDRIRLHSCQPEADVALFFRQMVFNAVIGNTDDHLKNFAMLREAEGYRLSPAFDLVPDVLGKGEHTLFFNLNPFTNATELAAVGAAWGVKAAREAILRVCDAALRFGSTSQRMGVAAASIEKFAPVIEARAARFSLELARPGA